VSKNRRIETLSRAYSILTGQNVTSSRITIMKTKTGRAVHQYNKCVMYENPAANMVDIMKEIGHNDNRTSINTQEIIRAMRMAEKEDFQVRTIMVKPASAKTKKDYYLKLKARKAEMKRSVKKEYAISCKE
jgi:hypothetical protein